MTVALISPLLQCSVWVLGQERGPGPGHIGRVRKRALIAAWISNLEIDHGQMIEKLYIYLYEETQYNGFQVSVTPEG